MADVQNQPGVLANTLQRLWQWNKSVGQPQQTATATSPTIPIDTPATFQAAPAGYKSPYYAIKDDGTGYTKDASGNIAPTTFSDEQQQQLAQAGIMPNGASVEIPSTEATVSYTSPEEGGGANVANRENTARTIGALAAVLQQQQANKPKLQQLSPATAGSAINAGNYIANLFGTLPNVKR